MAPSANSALRAATDEIVSAARGADPLRRIEDPLGRIEDPLGRIEPVLRDLTQRFHGLGALVHEEEDDEVLLHASDNLTIYHITLSPGLQYPPHNHLMDALIGIYRGGETNFIYPVDGGVLGVPERRCSTAPALVHLPPQTVHSVANTGSGRSGALHVYLGDLTHIHRQLWRDDQAEPFDNERYLAGASPIRQSVSGQD